jgi:hypothetical protein
MVLDIFLSRRPGNLIETAPPRDTIGASVLTGKTQN